MKALKAKGLLLDADYKDIEGNSTIRIFVKTRGKIQEFQDTAFKPYFYIITSKGFSKDKLLEESFEGAKVEKIEKCVKENAENCWKLQFKSTQDLKKVRNEIKDFPGVKEKREFDIPFAKRFLIDKQLEPMNGIKLDVSEEGKVIKAKTFELEPELKVLAFDLETYAPGRFSNPEKDPILMISLASESKQEVFTTKEKAKKIEGVKVFENEKEMIEAFVQEVKKENPEVIVTYNGDGFDFPYLKERCRKFKIKLNWNADNSEPKIVKKGEGTAAKLTGLQHLDAFQVVRLLVRFQVINLIKYDLESVVEALYGVKKEKINFQEINQIWDSETGLERLVKYNLEDSEFALKIVLDYLPFCIELSKLLKQSLFDASRISGGSLVEQLLINKSFQTNHLVPNKPAEELVEERMQSIVEGAFVKEPIPGLHESIAVIDFRSFHPTIMISHNIGPDTLECKHEECKNGKNKSPTGAWFCQKEKGFLASVMEQVLEQRIKWKQAFKKAKKTDKDYNLLFARQWALKIALNSFFGYMGYARSRWYCRECSRSILAWTRYYIKQTIQKAEEKEFNVLYSDTDSAFLKIPEEKSKQDVEKLVKEINSKLPEKMELELDKVYKRGIFVTKREGKQGAKKRYALIDFEDNLKIVGFEYVRRDWARIAKETQKQVIEAVLKEGKIGKAVEIVREKIKMLREGKVGKQDLIIFTQIQRPLDKYESIGPHVAAALKAVKKGKTEIGVGSVIGYIITKNGKSISDKAVLEEFVKEGNYDSEYYITHQVVPAVIRILQELGYSEQDLMQGGKQKSLSAFS